MRVAAEPILQVIAVRARHGAHHLDDGLRRADERIERFERSLDERAKRVNRGDGSQGMRNATEGERGWRRCVSRPGEPRIGRTGHVKKVEPFGLREEVALFDDSQAALPRAARWVRAAEVRERFGAIARRHHGGQHLPVSMRKVRIEKLVAGDLSPHQPRGRSGTNARPGLLHVSIRIEEKANVRWRFGTHASVAV